MIDGLIEDLIDDIDAHLPVALELDRAALLPGMYLAWCARLDLLDAAFAQQHAEFVLRARYGDGLCTELLVGAGGGALRYAHLNSRGVAFTRRYYSRYPGDWRNLFGADMYAVTDSWDNYQKIAAVLTEALLGKPTLSPSAQGGTRSKGWWQFWK